MSWTPMSDSEKMLFASILDSSLSKVLRSMDEMAAEDARLQSILPTSVSLYGGARGVTFPWNLVPYNGDAEQWIADTALSDAAATFIGFRTRAQLFVDGAASPDYKDAIADFFGVTPTP